MNQHFLSLFAAVLYIGCGGSEFAPGPDGRGGGGSAAGVAGRAGAGAPGGDNEGGQGGAAGGRDGESGSPSSGGDPGETCGGASNCGPGGTGGDGGSAPIGGSAGSGVAGSAGTGGTAPVMVCNPNAKQCTDGDVQTCKSDGSGWTTQTCEFLCSATSGCTGSCEPGATRCDGLQSQTCDATGAWTTTTTCPFQCSYAGECSGECVPDSKQCSGKNVQLCSSTAKWETVDSCQFACNFASGQASCGGSCSNGAKQCSGKTPQTCVNNAWTSGSACQYLCSTGSCTGECTPGAQRCGAQGGVQTCSPQAMWLQEGTPCPFTCTNGSCGGVCVPNAPCADDGNACTDDICNSTGAACTHPARANGSACGSSSTSACDNADSCQNGTCQANPKAAGTACTTDNNACTTDACNGAGTCAHNAAPANTVCRAASCSNGVVTAQATCGGSTTCPAASTIQCYGGCNETANACESPAPAKVDDGEVMALDSDATYVYSSVRIGSTSQIIRYTKSNNAKLVLFETTDANDWLSSLIVAGDYVYFSRVGADNVTGKVWMIQTSGAKQAGLQVSSDATFGFAKNSTRVYWSTARRYTCVCSNPPTINIYSVAIGGTTPTKYTRNFNGMEMSPDIEVDDTNLYVWEMGIQMNGPQVSQVYSPYLMAYRLADHTTWTQIHGSYFIESGVTYNLTGTNSTSPGITKQGSTIYANANLSPINSPMQISSDNLIVKYTGTTTRLTRKSPVGLTSKFAADASNVYIENMRIPVSGGSMSYWTNHQLGAITLDTSSVYFLSWGYWNEMPYQGNLDVQLSALMRVSK